MLRKIFTYVFAKRKILTLRHVTLRYVRVGNRVRFGISVGTAVLINCALP